jgi:hypothetical protein
MTAKGSDNFMLSISNPSFGAGVAFRPSLVLIGRKKL